MGGRTSLRATGDGHVDEELCVVRVVALPQWDGLAAPLVNGHSTAVQLVIEYDAMTLTGQLTQGQQWLFESWDRLPVYGHLRAVAARTCHRLHTGVAEDVAGGGFVARLALAPLLRAHFW